MKTQTCQASSQAREWADGNPRPGGSAAFLTFALARFPFVRWCWICVVCCSSAFAVPVKIELPAETAVFKAGQGGELANWTMPGLPFGGIRDHAAAITPPFWAASVKEDARKIRRGHRG
jgi:hypothetical protein